MSRDCSFGCRCCREGIGQETNLMLPVAVDFQVFSLSNSLSIDSFLLFIFVAISEGIKYCNEGENHQNISFLRYMSTPSVTHSLNSLSTVAEINKLFIHALSHGHSCIPFVLIIIISYHIKRNITKMKLIIIVFMMEYPVEFCIHFCGFSFRSFL